MTTAKLRNLSQFGVITDVDPFNLPPTAFSKGINVRFKNQSIERAPVFRRVPVSLAQTAPRFLTSNLPQSGFDTLYLGYKNGRVYSFRNGTETNVSVFGYANNDAETTFTSCHLGNVFYVNRNDRVPWSLGTSDVIFQNLANWDVNWRAAILRACGGALCAFNITKSGTNYPNMVKTSEFALANAVPTTWDSTVTTNNATENILAEMEGPIVDAQNFGDAIIVYSYKECWSMLPDGSDDIFSYRKLPFEGGVMNANCAVEVGGYHYVFGLDDIWRHDGVSKESLIDGKIKSYVFNNINLQKAGRCFVYHDRVRKEIRFCYASGDGDCSFVSVDGCNRCAVYNLVDQNWSFDDLPYVYGAAPSNLDTTLTWATVTTTWATAGGSWLDQEDSLKKITVMLGDSDTAAGLSLSLYAVDQQGPGSQVPYSVDTAATQGWTIERDGLDLDELPEVKDLRGTKVLDKLFPQARFESGASAIYVSAGGADNYNDTPTISDPQAYDADVYTQCDFGVSGRFTFLRITHDDYHYVKLTGFDLEVYSQGEN